MSLPTETPLHGVLPVLHTPLTERGDIDGAALEKEIDWAFEIGADGVVVAMVSEVLRLGYLARRELTTRVCAAVGSSAGVRRGFTVISVGSESTLEAIEFARHAESCGASAIMAIPPVATRLSGAATYGYFAAIAGSVGVPLVVQDASSYVGASIGLDVYLRLLEEFGPQRILFKPEANPLGPNLSRLRDATGGSARIFEGSGGVSLVDCYRRGIVGTMPGVEFLDGIVLLWRALREGNEEHVYALSFPIGALVAIQLQAGLDGFLAIEKYILKKRGLFPNVLQRQPVGWELDGETAAEVDRLFDRLQSAVQYVRLEQGGTV